MNLFKPAFKLIALFCAVGITFFATSCTPARLDKNETAEPQYDSESLLFWTADTIIKTNKSLVMLMDTLYQYVRCDSFIHGNFESRFAWMNDYREQLCKYYNSHISANDSISQFDKANFVIAEARNLWDLNHDDSNMGMTISLSTERTRLKFEEYNELAKFLDYCSTDKQRQLLINEFKAWCNSEDTISSLFVNLASLSYYGGSMSSIVRNSVYNNLINAHVNLYRNDFNLFAKDTYKTEAVGIYPKKARCLLIECCKEQLFNNTDFEIESEYYKELLNDSEQLISILPIVLDNWIKSRELWIEEISSDWFKYQYSLLTGDMLLRLSSIVCNI